MTLISQGLGRARSVAGIEQRINIHICFSPISPRRDRYLGEDVYTDFETIQAQLSKRESKTQRR